MKNELVWNVFSESFNGKTIEAWNIFEHVTFRHECKKIIDTYANDKNSVEEKVKRELQYYFWSKCEYEVIISGFPSSSIEKKVDVYTQVVMNWDIFFDYLWNHKELL